MEEEHVLCFPRTELERLGTFNGFSRDLKYSELLTSPHFSFQPRSTVETDPTFKQLIPYHVFIREARFLTYERTKKGGEQRLVQKRSIGFGGHINTRDCTPITNLQEHRHLVYTVGSDRELREELTIAATEHETQVFGFLNDESNEVGQVHFGVVHLHHIDDAGGVKSEDPAIKLIGFHSRLQFGVGELTNRPLENWSALVLKELFE